MAAVRSLGRGFVAAIALSVTAAGCAPEPEGGAAEQASVPVTLAIDGRANGTPSVAARGQIVVVTWGATSREGSDVYSAASRDGGRTYAAPVRVNHVAGDARLNGQQPPQVQLVPSASGDPQVAVVWASARTRGSVLLHTRSIDLGRSFAPATVVAGTDADGNRGWHATAVSSDGRVNLAWLDHRDYMSSSAGHAHHAAVGAEAAQGSKLHFSTLDGGVAPYAVAPGVCYCCRTAMAVGTNDEIYVAWRHVYPGNFRDMAFGVSRDGGRTFDAPRRISEDGWSIDGCPENGPTLAVDGAGRVHVAWATLAPGTLSSLALFYSHAPAAGGFAPRVRIDTAGTPSHPQMAIDPRERLTLVWDERSPGGRQIMMARALMEGASAEDAPAFSAPAPLSAGGENIYPAVAAAEGASIVAWSHGIGAESRIQVRRVP